MALPVSNGIGIKIAKAFGIQTDRLISFDLHFAVNDVVKATCIYATEVDADALEEIIDVTNNLSSTKREFRRV